MLVNTVNGNCKGFTKCKFEGTKAERRTLGMIGFPSERDFGNMVLSNLIRNCPTTSTDIANAKKIFGTEVPSIKGK